MEDNNTHKINNVIKDSPADRCNIVPGDLLLSINGTELTDIFDYYFYSDDEELDIEIQKTDGSVNTFHIVKSIGEDLGLQFENGLLDDYKSCSNKCMFCFIDQMPPGMRETLYFKDDDTRLSFLQGNYVTLTNVKDADIERIISYHLAPINISVHTTNPELRCKMLNNRFAGDILDKIKKIDDAGLEMNAQIVLCKGINDGKELERTISDLMQFENMRSLSVVPVGLTKFREGLYPLEAFEKEDANQVLNIIEDYQQKSLSIRGDRFVQGGDEWYLLAERPLPPEENYEGYIQLENGVGMLRLLMNEFREALAKEGLHLFMKPHMVTLATGKLAAPFLLELSQELMEKYKKVKVQVIPIENKFFGERITVSGLITGQDLIEQLKDQNLGDKLILPSNMLRAGEEVFLDDITLTQVRNALQVETCIVKSNGQSLVDEILDSKGVLF